MQFEPDEDDLLPPETWVDVWWGIFNRFAEECARYARYWGFL